MNSIRNEIALDVARKALAEGVRVFLSQDEAYGFITDDDGARVVSFQARGFEPSFSGNYLHENPRKYGQGWQIRDGMPATLRELLPAVPFRGIKGRWRYKTLDQYLGEYCNSSGFFEVFDIAGGDK